MNKIVVQGILLEKKQAAELEQEFKEKGIDLVLLEELNLSTYELGMICVTVQEAVQAIGYSALYDMLKFAVLRLLQVKKLPNKENNISVSIKCNRKESVLSFNFDLTEEQKEKVVDAAILKFLNN